VIKRGPDSSDMLGKIRTMPDQLRQGFGLSRDAFGGLGGVRPSTFVLAGMGASAIGGDLLRLYLGRRVCVPISVVRDYDLPGFVDEKAMVVVSSYSGNTDEALSAFRDALARKALVVCIASGGRLLDEARGRSLPCAAIPAGLSPRAALGYSFSALVGLAWMAGLCPDPGREILDCSTELEALCVAYEGPDPEKNPALRLAGDLCGRVPIVCSSTALEAVGVRWKNQFCENAKQLAFVSVLPEANHNEVMGWEAGVEGMDAGIVVLRTVDDHPASARSLALVRKITGQGGRFCGEFWGTGLSLLCRLFSLILLGDYASVYLAFARGVDPTPIGTIDRIKTWLKENGGEG